MQDLPIYDEWGTQATKNPQAIYESQQVSAAVSLFGGQELVKLTSNKVMLESEFKTFDSIMKSIPQTRLSIVPSPPQYSPVVQQTQNLSNPISQNNSIEFQLNQKGIIILALIFSSCFVATVSLIKIWGTTDIAQQQAYQERIDNQYREIGNRYDKLTKATEKLGKKSDICVSLYCGGNNGSTKEVRETSDTLNSESQTIRSYSQSIFNPAPSSASSEDEYKALIEVTRWKRAGHSLDKASAFVTWVKQNPRVAKSEGYPSHQALSKIINEIYNN